MNNQLLASFNALSNGERQILMALSVIYVPIGQTSFQELLKKSAVFAPNTVAIINKTLREKLQKTELMVISPDGWQCHPDVVEFVTRLAVQQPWFTKLATCLIADHKSYYYPARLIIAHAIKKLRIFLYLGNDNDFIANIRQNRSLYPRELPDIINRIFFNNFDAEWFASLSEPIKFVVLSYFVNGSLWYLSEDTLHYQLLEQFFGATKSGNPEIAQTVIEQRLLRGNFNDAETWLAGDESVRGLMIGATLRFLQNRNDEALEKFNAALKAYKKATGKRSISFNGLHGYFFSLALLRNRSFSNLSLLRNVHEITSATSFKETFTVKDFRFYVD